MKVSHEDIAHMWKMSPDHNRGCIMHCKWIGELYDIKEMQMNSNNVTFRILKILFLLDCIRD